MILKFKQFIQLLEATGDHFTNIPEFDPSHNDDHKELLDAWNIMPNMPNNHANRIRSIDQLRNEVKDGIKKLYDIKKDKEEKLYKDAVAHGHVERVYHNPDTGVKVYKPHNAIGCKAVQSGIINSACTFKDDLAESQSKFNVYDPTGQHSYVLHLDKEKDPRYQRIAAIGILPGTKSRDNRIVDKGNNKIPDEVWDRLRKEHDLDQIPALNGIKGIPLDHAYRAQELLDNIKSGKFSIDEINNAKKQRYWSPEHQSLIDNNTLVNNAIINKIDNATNVHQIFDMIDEFRKNDLWNNDIHNPAAKLAITKNVRNLNVSPRHFASDRHRELWDDVTNRAEFNKAIKRGVLSDNKFFSSFSPDGLDANGLWDKDFIPIYKTALTNYLKNGHDLTEYIHDMAKKYGYWDEDVHKDIMKTGLFNRLSSGKFDSDEILNLKNYDAFDPKLHINAIKKGLSKKLSTGNFTEYDIENAKKAEYWDDFLDGQVKSALLNKINSGNNTSLLDAFTMHYFKDQHNYWDYTHDKAMQDYVLNYLRKYDGTKDYSDNADKYKRLLKMHNLWDSEHETVFNNKFM